MMQNIVNQTEQGVCVCVYVLCETVGPKVEPVPAVPGSEFSNIIPTTIDSRVVWTGGNSIIRFEESTAEINRNHGHVCQQNWG